ncbi:hypothetical protein LXL04_029700 [Taraxacum kok-saghyz]
MNNDSVRSTTEISSKDLSEYLRDETVEIDTGNSSVETEKSLDAAGAAVGDRRGQRSWEPAIASCFLPLSLPRGSSAPPRSSPISLVSFSLSRDGSF